MVRLPHHGGRYIVVRSITVSLTALLVATQSIATAQPTMGDPEGQRSVADASPIDGLIAEAAVRFGIPERWIRVVTRAQAIRTPSAARARSA